MPTRKYSGTSYERLWAQSPIWKEISVGGSKKWIWFGCSSFISFRCKNTAWRLTGQPRDKRSPYFCEWAGDGGGCFWNWNTNSLFRRLMSLSITPLSSMENISSGRNIASGHKVQIVPWRNIASQQSLLPVKIFCPDIIFRFFHISSRRNIVLGDNFPWRNMDWLYKCAKFSSTCKIIFIFSCILSPVLWDNFLWMTLYQHLKLVEKLRSELNPWSISLPSLDSPYLCQLLSPSQSVFMPSCLLASIPFFLQSFLLFFFIILFFFFRGFS